MSLRCWNFVGLSADGLIVAVMLQLFVLFDGFVLPASTFAGVCSGGRP